MQGETPRGEQARTAAGPREHRKVLNNRPKDRGKAPTGRAESRGDELHHTQREKSARSTKVLRNLQVDARLGKDQEGPRTKPGPSDSEGGELQVGKPESAQPRRCARRPEIQGPSAEGTTGSRSRESGSWKTGELRAQCEGSDPSRTVWGRKKTIWRSQHAAAQATTGKLRGVAGKVAEQRRLQQRWGLGALENPRPPPPVRGM